MSDPEEFRRIALGMENAIEGAHMAHPDFRVNGRIFATLYPDGQSLLLTDHHSTSSRRFSFHTEPRAAATGRGH